METLFGLVLIVALVAMIYFIVRAAICKVKKNGGAGAAVKKAGISAVVFIIAGAFLAQVTPSQPKPAEQQVAPSQPKPAEQQATQTAQQAPAKEEKAAEPEQAKAEKPKVDFEKISSEVISDIKKYNQSVLSLEIKPESDRIVFRAVLNPDTTPNDALDVTDTILRKYAVEASSANKEIPSPGGEKNAFGGLYDYYDAVLEIIPEGSEGDKADWFIKQTIKGNKTNFLTTQKSHGGVTRK